MSDKTAKAIAKREERTRKALKAAKTTTKPEAAKQ